MPASRCPKHDVRSVTAPGQLSRMASMRRSAVVVFAVIAGLSLSDRRVTPSSAQEKPEPPSARVLTTSRGIAFRRGPSTGLEYVRSTDSDYRRTERLRFEVEANDVREASARLLGPADTPVNLPVSVVIRLDETTKQSTVVAEIILAPLAQAEYELELTIDERGDKNIVTYRFAVVP
jgi:hypothetical protein